MTSAFSWQNFVSLCPALFCTPRPNLHVTLGVSYCLLLRSSDFEWLALEMNRNHFVIFEIASKYCISDSFVDYEAYSISSKGFLPTVVDIMVT